MIHETSKKNEYSVVNSEDNFISVYEKNYVPEEFLKDIMLANVLILPYEGFRDRDQPFFPEETREIYEFIKNKSTEEITADICISDDSFKTLHLHSDIVNVPLIITTSLVLPVLVNIISDYLKMKKKEFRNDLNAKVEMIVDDGIKSKKISYEGNIEHFDECMKTIKNEFLDMEG